MKFSKVLENDYPYKLNKKNEKNTTITKVKR